MKPQLGDFSFAMAMILLAVLKYNNTEIKKESTGQDLVDLVLWPWSPLDLGGRQNPRLEGGHFSFST